jgi:hypothetical protein
MLFEGTHPTVMNELIRKEDWGFEKDVKKKNFKNIKTQTIVFFISKFWMETI